jgi:hypothetical protein
VRICAASRVIKKDKKHQKTSRFICNDSAAMSIKRVVVKNTALPM